MRMGTMIRTRRKLTLFSLDLWLVSKLNWGTFPGLDHGVGHPLLLLYDAKTPRGQKVKEFNGLGDDPFNASISLF